MNPYFTRQGIKFILSRIPTIPFRVRRRWYLLYNRWLFWLNDVDYGARLNVCNRFYLKKARGSHIIIGDDFTFSSGEAINPLSRNLRGCIFADRGATIRIGHHTGISSACIWAKTGITIGNRVKIGGDCILLDTDAHNLDYRIRASRERTPDGLPIDGATAASRPIIIEDDVLIGTRCIILKGVTIGARSIIGSGSVVTHSIPPDSIAAGNPCRAIKTINQNPDKPEAR